MSQIENIAAELSLWANESEILYSKTNDLVFRNISQHLNLLAAYTYRLLNEPAAGVTSFNTRVGAVSLLSSDVTSALGYTPVTQTRTLTINGVTYDLSANRSWTISTATPTLDQVTTAGNTTTNAITIGGLTVGQVGGNGVINFPISTSGFATSIYSTYAGNSLTFQIGSRTLQLNGGGQLNTSFNTTITGTTGAAALIVQQGNAAWSPVADFNGSAGTALRVNTNGNILIGTTTDAGFKLDVNGTARFVSAVTFNNSATNTIGGFVHSSSSPSNDAFYTLYLGSVRFYVRSDGYCKTTTSIVTNGVGSVDASAISQIDSTTKGFLQPRMTNAQAVAITTPATGLQVYDTTNNKNLLYNGTAWQNIATESWVSGQGYLTSTPTLDQVTTAGNTTTNSASISGFALGIVGAVGNTNYITKDIATTIALANSSTAGGVSLWAGTNASPISRVMAMGNGDIWMLPTTGVFIGTTTDAGYKLDVNGTARVKNDLKIETNTGGLTIEGDASGYPTLSINTLRPGVDRRNWKFATEQINAGDFVFYRSSTGGGAANTVVYSISKDGNFGLGTSTPSYPFHISSSAAANIFATVQATNASASAAWVGFNDQSDNIVYRVFGSSVSGTQFGQSLTRSASLIANLGGSGKFLIGSYSGTDLIFGTSDQARMRLVDSTGNFLIGTMTDSGHKLNVSGTAKIGSDLTLDAGLIIDSTDITNAWTAYTPAWTSNGGTQPTLGSGTITGFYKKIGKTVFVRVKLNFGLTTTGGTGAWLFSLPVNASSSEGIQFPCSMLDNGFAWYQGIVNGTYSGFTDKTAIIAQSPGGANSSQGVTGSFPFAWGNTDSLQFSGSYECI